MRVVDAKTDRISVHNCCAFAPEWFHVFGMVKAIGFHNTLLPRGDDPDGEKKTISDCIPSRNDTQLIMFLWDYLKVIQKKNHEEQIHLSKTDIVPECQNLGHLFLGSFTSS